MSPKWTINLSPVLTEQLASPEFQKELSFYYENVRRACGESRAHFQREGQHGDRGADVLLGRVLRAHVGAAPAHRRRYPGDVRRSAAGRPPGDHHVRGHPWVPAAAVAATSPSTCSCGRRSRRTSGTSDRRPAASGCRSAPTARATSGRRRPAPTAGATARMRPGIEEMLAAHGLEYFVADSHLVAAGEPVFLYRDFLALRGDVGDVPLRRCRSASSARPTRPTGSPRAAAPVSAIAFIRDPRTTLQVWSRDHGYPGEFSFLEFHKKHHPGGLRFWQHHRLLERPRHQARLRSQARGREDRAAGGPLRGPGAGDRRAGARRGRRAWCARPTTPSCSATGGSRDRSGSSTSVREMAQATACAR